MSRPWMPLYIADYLADTAHLNAAQSGAYLHLIMHYWQTGGLPNDDDALARIARLTSREWRRERETLSAFFEDGWRHKRIDIELAHALEISSKRRSAAKQRHCKSNANASANAEQMDTHARASSPSPSHPQSKDSDLRSDGASAPRDVRADLFGRGLKTLARISGKTPDSCRSLLGKMLKAVDDEAIHVLGAIEDADRNQYADPVAWIWRVLKSREKPNDDGRSRNAENRSLSSVARAAAERAAVLADPDGLRDCGSGASFRLISQR